MSFPMILHHPLLVNMPKVVSAVVPKNATLFSTTVLSQTDLYHPLWRLGTKEQELIQRAIWQAKQGIYTLANQVAAIANRQSVVLSACTEIPLILSKATTRLLVPVYNPAHIMAHYLKITYPGQLIGVIGGMGVEAGILFASTLSKLGNRIVLSNQEHPCRVAALEGRGPSPASSILSEIMRLSELGARIFIMACNTAYYFYPEITERI